MKRLTILLISALFLWYPSAYNQEKMEIEGAIIIKNSEDASPSPGTIRFNPSSSDFEGHDGNGWKSMTKSGSPTGSGMVTDIDGNTYLTVIIGTQTWMRENLRTSRYRNGDPIPEVLLNADWEALSTGAWNWYDHDPEKDFPYGKLYNWYAVNDSRGLCPTGWHIPSDTEWTVLTNILGGTIVAGGKMKTKASILTNGGYWQDPNVGATNESGFTGLPGGFRHNTGPFVDLDGAGAWWSSTGSISNTAWFRSLNDHNDDVFRGEEDRKIGLSVRCVKD